MCEILIGVFILLSCVVMFVSVVCYFQGKALAEYKLLCKEQKKVLKQDNYNSKNLRNSVAKFNTEMNKRLNEKEDKHGGDSWRDNSCNIDRLRNAMQKKVNQFHDNCFDLRQSEVKENCIDIANYSMMIVDRIDMNSDSESDVDSYIVQPDKPWERE